ncbi:hypothetical protein [Pseudoxanthomonas sp. X-1]|uniref:hypothetical protein n=1 Tax=Pseudoxanthomonas sp. X-1 TaxID=2571115 RepID=UPI001485C3F0|nr:hypothetical protein [Pseudoxanthomonas sp. X-1]UAY73122.1 hypothetical protein LAJ50_11370 [Pseudoxanthomonas sp. X-1]
MLLLLLLLLLLLFLLLLLPLCPLIRSGATSGQTPQGRRTWMCVVPGRGRMPRPGIPLVARTLRAAQGARTSVFSFGYFFCTSKEK